MTEQEFNHIYYKWTGDVKGIRPLDTVELNGFELREFIEFSIKTLKLEE